MAGIPHHDADSYIEKLINAGYKGAICDQTEIAHLGKILNRQISKILSPSTFIAENLLNPKHNQYLLSLKFHKTIVSIALLEVSTGEFQIADGNNLNELSHLFFALDPREILIDSADKDRMEQLPTRDREMLHCISANCSLTELPHYYFDQDRGLTLLLENFKVSNLLGYGINCDDPAITTAGALILYVTDNLRQKPNNITQIRKFQ
jgi:DNA mismatch repair protein MutS